MNNSQGSGWVYNFAGSAAGATAGIWNAELAQDILHTAIRALVGAVVGFFVVLVLKKIFKIKND